MSTPGTAALPASTEVVVVGGGVIGLSVAAHLARAGAAVVVLERDALGAGSSAKPLGGVRATFSDAGNIALGLRGLEAYERMDAEVAGGIGLRHVGYLFCTRTPAEQAAVEASTALQRSMGCTSRLVSAAEAAVLNPYLDAGALVGASFSPRDGYAEPALVVAAYAADARAHGAVVAEGVEVTGVEVVGGAVAGVTTSAGTVRCERVVCAAGAWSARIGAMAGVDLPVEPVRRQIGFTGPVVAGSPVPPDLPFTLDLSTTLYVHGSGGGRGLLVGISDPAQAPGFGRDPDDSWVAAFDAAARQVAPALAGLPLRARWAGLYENTPDHNALIGTSREVPGFTYATGFSGHGFLQAPAVGEVVRDLHAGREPFVDVTAFSADRFAAAALVREVHII